MQNQLALIISTKILLSDNFVFPCHGTGTPKEHCFEESFYVKKPMQCGHNIQDCIDKGLLQ